MFETFGTVTGVHEGLADQAVLNEHCVGCHQVKRKVYPWPMPGLGLRCAVCIVKESQENTA